MTSQAAQSKWRPYPDYRDSGVEWLGDIPAGWTVKRLKFLTKCLDGQRIPLNSEERGEMQGYIPYWGANGILDYVDRWLFDETLVLLGEDGAPFFDKNKHVAFLVSDKVWVNNHIHALRPNQAIKPKLLMHCLNCVDYKNFVDGSTRDKLTQSDMNNIQIPITQSISEQDDIVKYLDRETAKIDALIEKKRQLIGLFEEKRAAIISHAVTKGLDLDVLMKDSGVEWLGEIPAGWDIQRLKYICSLLRDGTHLPPPRKTTGYPLLSVRNIVDGNLVNLPDDSFISESDFQQLERSFSIRRDDILLAIVGATLGKVAIVGEMSPFQIQRSLAVFRPRSEIICFKYLSHFFRGDAFQKLLWRSVGFSAQPGIYLGTLSNIHVTIPQIDEQLRIVNFLDCKIAKIDTIIQKIHEAINKLQEYRTALISSAVTGKIDVREESL